MSKSRSGVAVPEILHRSEAEESEGLELSVPGRVAEPPSC